MLHVASACTTSTHIMCVHVVPVEAIYTDSYMAGAGAGGVRTVADAIDGTSAFMPGILN